MENSMKLRTKASVSPSDRLSQPAARPRGLAIPRWRSTDAARIASMRSRMARRRRYGSHRPAACPGIEHPRSGRSQERPVSWVPAYDSQQDPPFALQDAEYVEE